MKESVLYIHGKGGSAAESAHYEPLFPGAEVYGLDYESDLPWEAGIEIRDAVERLKEAYESVTLIANSIGAYFSMHAGIDALLRKAFFISPVVDMEQLITALMRDESITEEDLRTKGKIKTASGEDFSWDYLSFVRSHPIRWTAPTEILYGENDALTPFETVAAFARRHHAGLTVMEGGEHWFHTAEQMAFLDAWILRCEAAADDPVTLETNRLKLYPATAAQMEAAVAAETDEDLKAAYRQMLEESLLHSGQWVWYAMWRIEQKDGTPVGDLCFKGLDAHGVSEIGYGIAEAFRGRGYATEAVQAALSWAFRQPEVTAIEAEADKENAASQNVLKKCGFLPTGTYGAEGPRFIRRRKT